MVGRIGWLTLFAGVWFGATASAQFQTRWRDQRMPSSRPSPYLSLLSNGTGNRAIIYQGIVRPQVDLQTQITTQDRQIDRVMTATGEVPGMGTGLGRTSLSAGVGANAQSSLGLPTLDRLRASGGTAARVDAGHPVYFQYRDQYFPGFKHHSGGP